MAEQITWKTGNSQFDNYTQHIADAIKKYLDEFAAKDEHFGKCYANPSKNFEECMIYVINRVWEDPTQSPDECCYQNARHYYLDDIKREECRVQKYNNKDFDAKPEKKKKVKTDDADEAEEQEEEVKETKPKKAKAKKPQKPKPEPELVKAKTTENGCKPKKQPKEVAQKVENKAYEQIDLFSLLED